MAKCGGEMLILGLSDIVLDHNIVEFSVWFLQLTALLFKNLVASHVTEPGSLLTKPVL